MTAATTVFSSWIIELQRTGSVTRDLAAAVDGTCPPKESPENPHAVGPVPAPRAAKQGLTRWSRDTGCHCTDGRGDDDMSDELKGKTVAFLVAAEGTEQ